jgi:hypothetical protein
MLLVQEKKFNVLNNNSNICGIIILGAEWALGM